MSQAGLWPGGLSQARLVRCEAAGERTPFRRSRVALRLAPLASVCLALYIAFWLELDNAYWAGTTAAIVCQPSLGARCVRAGRLRMVGLRPTSDKAALRQFRRTGSPSVTSTASRD
jgi:hypothetical protein